MEVPCLRCGESGEVFVLLDDGTTLRCRSCDSEYTIDDVKTAVAGWTLILAWIESHPSRKKGG